MGYYITIEASTEGTENQPLLIARTDLHLETGKITPIRYTYRPVFYELLYPPTVRLNTEVLLRKELARRVNIAYMEYLSRK